MNPDELHELIEQHAAYPHLVLRVVQGVDSETLRQRESAERWSPLEILAHVADEEVEDFRPRAQAAAVGAPVPWAIDPARWVSERGYNAQDPADVLQRLAAEREASCAWLRNLSMEALDSALEDPQLGRMRCGDFVAAWRLHDLLHLRQLVTALAVLTARRFSDCRTEYAGRLPEKP
jgi:hypothetical protein